MPLSDVFGQTSVRTPRLRVLANGVPLVGVQDAALVNNNHFASDRFHLGIAMGADPVGYAELAAQVDVLIDVQVSLDGASFVSMLQGAVDTLVIDTVGQIMRLDGRDLSAGLIEARTQETFANRTASEIAQTLAERHGLDADVQATTTLAGRYWQIEHDRIVLNQFGRATTEWDLLVTLAQFEGFDVWMTGTTLHFRAAAAQAAAATVVRPVATVSGPANVMALRLERSLTLARDIQVIVKSWNSRQRNAFVQTARRQGHGATRGKVQTYVYVVPNLTPDDALKYAQSRLAELTRHERVVTAEMPGELRLMPRMKLRIEGTGTDFDQDYWVDRVERHFSVQDGFSQSVHARNTSETSQAVAPGDRVSSIWTNS